MMKSIRGTGFRPASACLLAICMVCSLVISFGASVAADRDALQRETLVERDSSTATLSQSAAISIEARPVASDTRTPDVAGCPITVLPNNSGTSGNERAPNANFLNGRAVYLITAAEAAANGLTSGTVPSAIGWNYFAAPGITATGTLIVYLQNTGDTTNLKSTTWATAITGMTVVHNATTTLPNVTGPFDINFSGGVPFTYTGGALYVAFDWSWSGTTSVSASVYCNTALTNGLKGANGSGTPPATVASSNFRPETRLTPSVATIFNDASVDYVISYGSLATPLVGPQTVKAVITNKGANALTNLPVTLNLTGANTFTNLQTVVGPIAGCGGQAVVTFAPFTPTALGSDTVTVSVPADQVASNNSKSKPLAETSNLYSYKHAGTTAAGGFGNTAAIAFAAKFNVTAAAKVSAITPEFFATSATTYRVGIFPDSGGAPGLVPLYLDAADRTVTAVGPVTITLPTPVAVGPGNFYAVVEQTNATNMSLSYDAETPIRAGSFYAAFAVPPASWADFSPLNNFKPNIGVTLIQCTSAAECNDNNACTDDACTNNLCVHTNNSVTECDNNPCSSPDVCSNGVCTPGPNPCNDNNACTVDLCAAGGGCTNTPVNCDDNNPCTDDSCLPASGCAHANNTAACTDNNPCTIGDVCAGGVCVPGSAALPAPVQFCNNAGITIPTVGSATPYPSTITVAGQPSIVCSTTVNLNGFSHTYPSDVDVLLARSAGSNAVIMSRVGGSTGVSGVNLLLSDAAATSMSTPLVSGTFKPTNLGFGTFPAPAPAPTGGSALAAFNGTNPNGAWDLWVNDEFSPDGGGFTGWCVNLVSVCLTNAECDDANPCTNDSCNGGTCVHANNTNACNDNNACTANDTCANGVCVGGPPPPCDDGNACTANICNTQTGLCENPAIVCNDNNTCTDDTCNPATGCVFTPNNANTCTDNSLCTPTDLCVNGVCVGQNPVVCTPDANPCTTEACNPATGQCASTNNTGPCDDGNPCTTGDICGPGVAFSENFDAAAVPALPAGWTTSVTGTGNVWTTDNTAADTPPNSAFGFDGAAVADEVLVSPVINIVSSSAKLSFQNRWTFEGTTSFFDGGVLEISINGGAFTDIVTAGGSFVSGGYTGTISSSFSNPLAGRSAWGGVSVGYPGFLTTVVNLPAAAAGQPIQLQWRVGSDTSVGAAGQNIDSIAILDGANVCTPGAGTLNCDDNNPCTDDYCDPQLGCQHAPNNADCDDNNACTTLDVCNNGTCGGTPVNCNDFNPCTTDTCVPASGCTFTANTNPCSDGNACTAGDTCSNGVCNPGTAVVCNDNNVCTTDSCNPASGCVFAANTNACDDGNPCTVGDTCGNGVCNAGTTITAPAEATGVAAAADKTTFSWTAVPAATQYDVVRGSLSAFPVGPGGGDESCFNDLAVPSLSDGTVPAAGSGFWYLSRGQNACGNGTYGTQGVNGVPGAPRITTTCP